MNTYPTTWTAAEQAYVRWLLAAGDLQYATEHRENDEPQRQAEAQARLATYRQIKETSS